jgi:hypothetical protein
MGKGVIVRRLCRPASCARGLGSIKGKDLLSKFTKIKAKVA